MVNATMTDRVINGKTRTRREFCSYYTESDPILTYMVDKLQVTTDDHIFEPCAGDGIFIEKIISSNDSHYKIDAMDLNPVAIEGLQLKFEHDFVSIRNADTLLDSTLDLFANSSGLYNKIIGNPPYGAWQDIAKRDVLKKLYGGYVKETYTLFIKRCIDLLKENGRLVFIVPDTFLALHLHKDTREKILNQTKVEEILLIPSKFFPGVNFGYSNLCIITLVKSRKHDDHRIKIFSVSDDVNNLYELAKDNYSVVTFSQEINQKDVMLSKDSSFLLGGSEKIREFINGNSIKLGDLADCVTGFYTGENKKFLTVLDPETKGAKDYLTIGKDIIEFDYLKNDRVIYGLTNGKKYIPILKGGNGVFIKKTEWFVKWDKTTVDFYHEDKKARFQNSQYYFREGIGVPMVKSSVSHAFLLERRIFDQSIVGIFPKDFKHLNYLLAFLNSDVCAKLMKTINHTANNSANYLKKLPIILDPSALIEIDKIFQTIKLQDLYKEMSRINHIFDELYQI